ncbi:DUF2303 family protein [Jannaschia formosa]|uniref:DUF2303 family protein n=1 Tax=Jannaschia formosa TaxID=2259592 RepID=UPI00143175B3|nr:DUF2303 family protein [Jannaschia formosa]
MTERTDAREVENVAQTMRDTVQALYGTRQMFTGEEDDTLTQAIIHAVPEGMRLEDLTAKARDAAQFFKPARRRGTATLADLDSLVGWAIRFKGETSALFADPDMEKPSLTCVADYHAKAPADVTTPTGDPSARHCAHRGVYKFPLSDEWKAWMAVSGKPLDKDEMGEFIEANAKDVMDPTPGILNGDTTFDRADWEERLVETAKRIEGRFGQLTELLRLSKQFRVYEVSNLEVSTNRDTGEAAIQFLNEHRDKEGAPISIPNLIIVAIPVFRGGTRFRMVFRFRYRKSGPKVSFILSAYDPDRIFRAAFDETIADAAERTALPLFLGTPET